MKEERKKKCFFLFLRILNILTHMDRGENTLKKTNSNVYSKGSEKNVIE